MSEGIRFALALVGAVCVFALLALGLWLLWLARTVSRVASEVVVIVSRRRVDDEREEDR